MADANIGKAYVQIIPSTKGIKGALANLMKGEADDAGQKAGDSLASRIKSALVKASIGTAVAAVFKSALDEGAKLEQSIGGIETLFKDSAGKMESYAKQAFKTAGLSANDYMEQATSFAAGLIKSCGGDTAKATEIANMAMIDMSDNMNKMGSNAEDIQNAYQGFAKQNYTMLDNLKLGYGGTKEEMQRLLEDAQKLTGVKYDIDNLSDVYSAIHAIQEDLDITGTTAKEASTTFSGSFGMMKASAQNLLGYMATGMDIGPAVKDLVESASTFVFGNALPMIGRFALAIPGALASGIKTAIPLMIEKGKEVIQSFGEGMAKEFPALAGIFNNLLPILETVGGAIGAWKIAEMLMKIPAAISTVMGPISSFLGAVTAAGGGISGFGTAIMSLIGGPITLITAGIAAVVAAFMHLWNTNEEFRTAMIEIWDGIVAKVNEFCQGVVDRVNALGFDFQDITEVLKAIWNGFCEILAPVFEVAFQLVADVLSVALDILMGLLEMFTAPFSGGWEQFGTGLSTIAGAAWDLICSVFSNAFALIGDLLNVFLGWFGTSWQELWAGVQSFFENIWTSICDFFEGIWTSIIDFCSSAWEMISNIISLGIQTCAELIHAAFDLITIPFQLIWQNCGDFLKEVWSNMTEYLNQVWQNISQTCQEVWKNVSDFLRQTWGNIKSNVEAFFTPIRDFIMKVWENVKQKTAEIWNGISSTISAILGNIRNTISNIFENIRNTISNVINSIRNFVRSGFEAVKSNIVNPIQNAYGMVSAIFGNIKTAISNKIIAARDVVRNAIDRIRSFFNFSWSLPRLRLPHITISGSFSLTPPSVPHFGISWYAKAMDAGMILNSPTIFGFDGNRFLGGGEAGPEVVVGLQSLMSMVRDAVEEAKGNGDTIDYAALAAVIVDAIRQLHLETIIELDSRVMAKGLIREIDKELQRLAVAK